MRIYANLMRIGCCQDASLCAGTRIQAGFRGPKKNVDTGFFAHQALCDPRNIIYAIVMASFVSAAS